MDTYHTIEHIYQLFLDCHQKITTDTRRMEKGSLFFALKGENFDANSFAIQAIESGCAYAFVDNEQVEDNKNIIRVKDVLQTMQQLAKHHRQQLKIPVIGITGSNGKTTNKELIHAVLSEKYLTYATKGNLNNHIGVPLTLLSITRQHELAIIEMGANHQGEIDLLCGISDPDFGIITNIGKAHLEGFGGEEGVKKGKSELYRYIKHKNGTLFVNGNDQTLMELSNGIQSVYFGEESSFDIYGCSLVNSEYVEFKWNSQHNSLDNQPLVKTHMFGHYNFINLLCAVCIGHYFKVDVQSINRALSNYIPEMNRSQVKKTETNTLILDAYNANPSSMGLAIDNFLNQALSNKVLILGDMLELGEYSVAEHRKIIQQINGAATNAVFVGQLFYEFKNEFKEYHFFKNSEDAADYFRNTKLTHSTVLIKGSRGIKLETLTHYL